MTDTTNTNKPKYLVIDHGFGFTTYLPIYQLPRATRQEQDTGHMAEIVERIKQRRVRG